MFGNILQYFLVHKIYHPGRIEGQNVTDRLVNISDRSTLSPKFADEGGMFYGEIEIGSLARPGRTRVSFTNRKPMRSRPSLAGPGRAVQKVTCPLGGCPCHAVATRRGLVAASPGGRAHGSGGRTASGQTDGPAAHDGPTPPLPARDASHGPGEPGEPGKAHGG